MSQSSLQIPFKLTKLLSTCNSLSSLKALHSLTIAFGLSHHLPTTTKLLSHAATLSPSILYARHLFDQIPNPDSFLFNTFFRAYSNLGPLHEIFPLYAKMHRLGLPPDHFTFPFILRSSAVLSLIPQGKQAHCNAFKCGLHSVVFVNASLVFFYSSCALIPDMELVFSESEYKNVELWTSLVSGYVQNSMFRNGMDVFCRMVEEDVRPNEVTVVSVLPACNTPSWLDSGRSLHGFVIKLGFDSFVSIGNALIAMYGKCGDLAVACNLFDGRSDRNLVCWNTMIAVYEQSGNAEKAIELFRKMIAVSKFSAVTMVSVISACATLAALDIGKWVHELAVSKGLHSDVRVSNALINMYSNCGNLNLALDVFTKTEPKGVVSWSAIIGAYAAHGHAKEALELFNRMKGEGVKPNSFTYTSVLSACSHAGLVDEGMRHFDSMKREYGIAPKVEHCACVVDLMGRAGRLKEAHVFVKGMELKPDEGVWGALLAGCRMHGDVEMAELVAGEVFGAEKTYSATFFVLMANVYADAGKWKEAARMRRLMEKNELKKLPGCSSVRERGFVDYT